MPPAPPAAGASSAEAQITAKPEHATSTATPDRQRRVGHASAAAETHAPVTVRVALRQEDLSPAGHIGNAAVVQLIEEARNRLFRFGGEDRSGTSGPALLGPVGEQRTVLVAQQTVEYAAEMFYGPDPMLVGFWVGHIGGSSFTLDTEIRAAADAEPLVRAEAVVVLVDTATSRPAPIDAHLREHFAQFHGEPILLRPRPGADR
ncbi:MAG: thioesterase family protein [Tomitella sp.]|nr:thioesterase family protein [Tomitella sp.]